MGDDDYKGGGALIMESSDRTREMTLISVCSRWHLSLPWQTTLTTGNQIVDHNETIDCEM